MLEFIHGKICRVKQTKGKNAAKIKRGRTKTQTRIKVTELGQTT